MLGFALPLHDVDEESGHGSRGESGHARHGDHGSPAPRPESGTFAIGHRSSPCAVVAFDATLVDRSSI